MRRLLFGIAPIRIISSIMLICSSSWGGNRKHTQIWSDFWSWAWRLDSCAISIFVWEPRRNSCLGSPSRCSFVSQVFLGGFCFMIFLGTFFVTQISQMTQIFLRGSFFCPTDFTDFHRFFYGISLSYPRGYLQRPNRSPPRKSVSNRLSRKPPNKFRGIRWKKSASSAKFAWQKIPRRYSYLSIIQFFLT